MNIISHRGLLVMLAAAVVGTGVAIEAQKPGAPPTQPASAKPADAAKPTGSFDRYHSPQEANAALVTLNKANPAQTALHKIATSPGGVDLVVLEVGPDVGRKVRKTPAVFVVANMEGVVPISTEAALSLADRVASPGGALKSRTWFFLPNGNPDAATRYARRPLVADERNASRWNDDMDDQADEDGPDDLDGNGVITEMRVKDPAGEWIPVEGEPRLMRKADPAKGEKGTYKLYVEGTDNDGDGDYNEDPAGGTNIGVTFPHLFRPWTATGGRWPGSEPETFAIMRFAIEHPEIAMTFAFGSTNMCLQPPAGGRQGSFDANAIKIPESMAPRLGADASRTYTMKEIIDLVRPLAPPGFEITEGMIASFLGLGAVVNPLEDDLKFYKELSEKYKELLKANKLDAKRLDPPQPKDGSFELWSYYHLGVPVFSMDLWTLPEVKAEEKDKSGVTPESLEAMTPDAFVALGEAKIATFLKEVGAPDTIKPLMLLEGVKSGKMTPKQMAGMLKQMPKPKDAAAADPKQKALVAFSDKELQGKGYVNWTPFKHPQFGDIEIGGWVKMSSRLPHPFMLPDLAHRNASAVLFAATQTPSITLDVLAPQKAGADLYRLRVRVVNGGSIPTLTYTAVQRKIHRQDMLTVSGPAVKVVAGGRVSGAPIETVAYKANRPELQFLQVPGDGKVEFEFLVSGKGDVTVAYQSQKAGRAARTIVLR